MLMARSSDLMLPKEKAKFNELQREYRMIKTTPRRMVEIHEEMVKLRDIAVARAYLMH